MFKQTHIAATAPTVNDDFSAGFREGVYWFNTATDDFYICTSDAEGAASWETAGGTSINRWDDWTPSLAWAGNTPSVGVTTIGRYVIAEKICLFTLEVSGTNTPGAAITGVTIGLPATAAIADTNSTVPIDSFLLDDGGYTIKNEQAKIDSIADPAVFIHNGLGIAASHAFTLYYYGEYEMI